MFASPSPRMQSATAAICVLGIWRLLCIADDNKYSGTSQESALCGIPPEGNSCRHILADGVHALLQPHTIQPAAAHHTATQGVQELQQTDPIMPKFVVDTCRVAQGACIDPKFVLFKWQGWSAR